LQCADITFAEPEDVPEVNETNCFNSTKDGPDGQTIGFQLVYTTTSSRAYPAVTVNAYFSMLVPVMLAAASWITYL
jgi:hypothetical protein